MEAPPLLKERQRNIPKQVSDLVMSALAKDPAGRPSTAAAFAIALRTSAEGESPLLDQANDLYRKFRSTFICISTLIYTPFIILGLFLLLATDWLYLLFLPILLFANTLDNTA